MVIVKWMMSIVNNVKLVAKRIYFRYKMEKKRYIFRKGRSAFHVDAKTILDAKKELKNKGKEDYKFSNIKLLTIKNL